MIETLALESLNGGKGKKKGKPETHLETAEKKKEKEKKNLTNIAPTAWGKGKRRLQREIPEIISIHHTHNQFKMTLTDSRGTEHGRLKYNRIELYRITYSLALETRQSRKGGHVRLPQINDTNHKASK